MAVRSLNKVMLIGNLTRDPNLRYTPNNTAVCSFGLATNRSWNNDDGSQEERTDFHNIVAWAKLAEICNQILLKGDKVFVEGRLQTREWKSDDGADRRITEIVLDSMIKLSPQREGYSDSSDDGASAGSSRGSKTASTPKKVASSEKVEESPNSENDAQSPATDEAEIDLDEVADDIPF